MKKIKSITTAKKLFDNGAFIRIVPNKINSNNIWGFYADIKKLDKARTLVMNDVKYVSNFTFIVNNFKHYNCNYENGYYMHFYLLDDK